MPSAPRLKAALVPLLMAVAVCATAGVLLRRRAAREKPGADEAAPAAPGRRALRWAFETEGAVKGAAAVASGAAFVASLDGHLYAIELSSGEERWKYKAESMK